MCLAFSVLNDHKLSYLTFCVEENHSRVSHATKSSKLHSARAEVIDSAANIHVPALQRDGSSSWSANASVLPLCSGSGQTRLQHRRQEAENWPYRFQAPHPQRGGHALVPAESKCRSSETMLYLSQLKQFGFDNFFIS